MYPIALTFISWLLLRYNNIIILGIENKVLVGFNGFSTKMIKSVATPILGPLAYIINTFVKGETFSMP